jgi:hypothetical protein
MNVGDISIRVRRQFGDQFSTRITEEDILRWINDGMREVAQKNELLQVTATIPTAAGVAEYPFPDNALKLLTVTQKGRPLRGLGFKEYLNFTQDANNVYQGVPDTFTVWAGNIWLNPMPQFPGELKIFYVRHPVEVEEESDVPELPSTYHMRLVEYCLAQAAEFDENDEQYDRKMSEFVNNTAVLKDDVDWTERDSYPVISAQPSEYGDPIHSSYDGW